MSWLNLNQSLNSLKGQITNIASEVFSEAPVQEAGDDTSQKDSSVTELEDKCRNLELETASLKKLVDELRASLQSERLSRKNGVKEEEANWYWDPSPQASKQFDNENQYKIQIRALQDELSALKERETVDLRPDEELYRLREENKNLTSNLEDLDSQHQQAMERLLTLKKDLQTNFEVLKQEHEDLKNSNDEYSNEIKSLMEKIGERDSEIEILKASKSDYDTLLHKYQTLERIHGLLRENAEKFQEENQELHEEVFKLQEQVTKLEHDIEVETKQSETSDMVPRHTYEELLNEINSLKERRNSNQVHLDEINIDDNAKSVIDSLRREINDLKHKLSQKETLENGDNKSIKPETVMKLYNKYVNFELPIDYVGEIPSAGDNIVLFKLESVFKTVHSFKKELDGLEHKLSEKNLNSNHLQTQIDDLTTENDFLTTDIQHLERELSEMKKNNDFLISEIAALKNTSKLEPIIETHEDNLAKLETELADCNKLNKNFESEIARIEKELKEVRLEKVALKDSLSDLRHKYTTMLSEFEMCKNQTKELIELENCAKSTECEQLKKAVEEIDTLNKRLVSANAKSEQLSIDIHVLENDKIQLTKQIIDLKAALESKANVEKELESLKLSLDEKIHDYGTEDVVSTKKDELDDLDFEQATIVKQESGSTSTTAVKSSTDHTVPVEKTDHQTSNSSSEEEMKSKILSLQQQSKTAENNALKEKSKAEEVIRSQQQTIEELTAKIIQQDILRNKIDALKNENHNITERKMQLENELASTDSKIVHLEEEFDKLVSDLNEKDTLIDGLNSTLQQNNITLANLNQTVTDLENSIVIKNAELERLKTALEEANIKVSDSTSLSNHSQDELNKLQLDKEEATKAILVLNDEIEAKNAEISALTNRLDESDKLCVQHKTTVENKDKEIKELSQSIVELTDKIKNIENVTHQNDDYAKLVQELSEYKHTIEELKEKHAQYEYMIARLNSEKDTMTSEKAELIHQYEKTSAEFKTMMEAVTNEKTELINLINLKHNESIQYHNEIQRLNHVILEHTNEFKKVVEERDQLLQGSKENCSCCERLRITLKEKDDIIMSLNDKATAYDRVQGELVTAIESTTSLKERCDNLDKSLAIQLDVVRTLTAQNAQLSEQMQNSERELERLRRHLVETEENYTQELMASEQKLTECQTRLHQVEEKAKQTSTVYTSNSIRANQEVETLRNQIKLIEKQRDDVQVRLSEAEDARSRSEAALTNLQVVLEQFQLDKERDIHAATEKIRNKMEELKRDNVGLHNEIDKLKTKLEEALAGLQAATRLGDQVETKTAQINDLKEQVRTLQTSVAAAEERYYNAISNQQDKVDKNLVKNLVINYVMTGAGNQTNRTQVLRVLSTVLDFNQQECERLGLARSTTTPDSLAAEFVKFLQNESRPRAPLPNMMNLAQTSRSTTPSSRKNSTIGPPPTQSTKSGHSRNPSTGSNNLLFSNIDTLDTASQRSRDSDRTDPRVVSPSLDTGVNQTRNTEGAILKSVLKDM
ncbi:uncharacterized protein LOC142984322 [Anticarsia gemmatalis]|uniref:uncharacterized protein LOC142984322 n=1 Tax=Anticarsia gemmatalis TaxID=129554 RepID=UPI003F75EB4E